MTHQRPAAFLRIAKLGSVLAPVLLLVAVACGTQPSDLETPDLAATSPSASPTSVAATPDIVADASVAPTTSDAAPTPSVEPTVVVMPDASTATTEATPTSQPAVAPATATPTQTPSPTATATAVPMRKIGYKVGEQAPDFTLHAVNGETYTLSDIVASGRPVLLYFFASW